MRKKRATYLLLNSHPRPKALHSVIIWCCHQLCTSAGTLGLIFPFRALSSACWSPQGLHPNLRFVIVCVTLEKYTQKLIGQLPFSLSFPSFLDILELHHSLLPLSDFTLWNPPLWAGPTSFSLSFLQSCRLFLNVIKEEWQLFFAQIFHTYKRMAVQHLSSSISLLIWMVKAFHGGTKWLSTEHWKRQGGQCQGKGGPTASGSAKIVEKNGNFP